MFRASKNLIFISFVFVYGGAVFAQNPTPVPPTGPVVAPNPRPKIRVQTPGVVTPAPSVSVEQLEQTPRPRPAPAPKARRPEPPEADPQSGPVTAKLERGGKVSITGP